MGHFISSKPLQMNFIISEIERLGGLRVKRWPFALANPRGMLGSISLIFMHLGGEGEFFPELCLRTPIWEILDPPLHFLYTNLW